MSKAGKAHEAVKTALIVLLAASAVLLGWRTRLFDDIFRMIPFFGNVADLMWGGTGTQDAGGLILKEAARPLCIVITNDECERYGVRYETETRNSVYDRASSIMSEALGSASQPREIGEEEWRGALLGAGVFFSYASPVKLSVLDGWLGTKTSVFPDDVSVRNVFVAFGKDRSRIFFQDHESGRFYGAETASSAGKAQELGIYNPNGAMFAFEANIETSAVAPYIIILTGDEHPDAHAGPSGTKEELLGVAVAALGHEDETYTVLSDGDGALRCVGTQFNVRADDKGYVFYRRTDSLPPAEERLTLSEGEMIEQARVIAENTIGALGGNAEVFFESSGYDVGYFSVYFGYYLAGGRVYLSNDANAAKVNFLSGVVRDIELNFRSFTFDGAFTRLLPERQAYAAAGGEFELCYSDTGAETIQPFWH